MRKGYNPTRRNRNIGTSKRGHGANNRLVIPSLCHTERAWWGVLGDFKLVSRAIGRKEVAFIVEKTRGESVHACTVDDLCRLLLAIPAQDWEDLDTFVLRQSTRKQWLLSPTWGRLVYSAELGRPGKRPVRCGPAVFLEAMNPSLPWRWDKSMNPAEAAELKRLISDGHQLEGRGKNFLLHSSIESVRATQLYRTVLHEIGHWVDWLEKVEHPSVMKATPFDVLERRYFARPSSERESFAHRYADALRARLFADKVIPFPRIEAHTPVG